MKKRVNKFVKKHTQPVEKTKEDAMQRQIQLRCDLKELVRARTLQKNKNAAENGKEQNQVK